MRGIIDQEMFDCIPEIDFNSGYRYFVGNMDNYTSALLSTLKSIKVKLPILDTMNYTGEYEGLRTITQTLRKMLLNIGALGLADATYQLETVLLNDDSAQLSEQLAYYTNSLCLLADHLELLLKKADLKSSAKTEDKPSGFLNYDFTKTRESIRRSADLLERKII